MVVKVALCTLAAFATGCASVGQQAVSVAGGTGEQTNRFFKSATAAKGLLSKKAGTDTDCDDPPQEIKDKLKAEYIATLGFCRDVLAGFESNAQFAKYGAFSLALLGGIAGAVVVPALAAAGAAKSAIAAWGGVAGLTNYAQQTVSNVGLGPATYLADRELLRQEIFKATSGFNDPKADYCERVSAVGSMHAACINYQLVAPKAEVTPWK
jgi:hypothetical protein